MMIKSPDAEAITEAVETVLENQQVAETLTPQAKEVIAHDIYTTWRNQYLRNVNQAAFTQIETAAPALIAAIAAQL